MKVLIATHHYYDLTGSETFAYTLAKTLMFKGCNVTIYSPYIGGVITEKTLQLGIPIISNLQEIKEEKFDVIHLSHNLVAIEVRYCFPYTPIIFLSHGVLPFLEQPPLEDLNISKYLVVSEEVKGNLIQRGIPNDSILIFRNIIDTQRFYPLEGINEGPKRVLVNSRRMDQQTKSIVAEACKRLSLEMKFIGNPGNIEWDVEKHINQVDICISLGRGILEAMSCGRAAIVFDYDGGDGLVTVDNIDEIQKCNFSGRKFKKRFGVEGLVQEITGYDQEMGTVNRKIIEDKFSATKNVESLIGIYEEVINTFEEKHIDFSVLKGFVNFITETRGYSSEIQRRNYEGVLKERQEAIDRLVFGLEEKERVIGLLRSDLVRKEEAISALNEGIRQKDLMISESREVFSEKTRELEDLRQSLLQKEALVFHLESAIRDKDVHISHLEGMVSEKDAEIGNLKETLSQRAILISHLEGMVREKEREIGSLNEIVSQKETQISQLESVAQGKEATLNHIYNSHGWKALLVYYRLRNKIFPINSKRRLLAQIILNSVKHPGNILKYVNKINLKAFSSYIKTVKPAILEERAKTIIFDRAVLMHCDSIVLESQIIEISGWAISPNGIEKVEVFCDGKLLGQASYGRLRPDVQATYHFVKNSDCSGFLLSILFEEPLDSGKHTLLIKAIASDGQSAEVVHSHDVTGHYQNYLTKVTPTVGMLDWMRRTSERFHLKPHITFAIIAKEETLPIAGHTIDSIISQSYPFWDILFFSKENLTGEMITKIQPFINNNQLKVYPLEELRIVLDQSRGEFLGILISGDRLMSNALFEMIKKLNMEKDLDLIYTDDDTFENGGTRKPFFKPDWSPDLLLSMNYIGTFLFFKKRLLDKIDFMPDLSTPVGIYDLILRITEHTHHIGHIPSVLYTKSGSPEASPQAGKKVLEETLMRRKIKGEVVSLNRSGAYRVRREISGSPRVSIIIPTAYKNPDLFKACLYSILKRSAYANYEILIVDNSRGKLNEKDLMEIIPGSISYQIIRYPKPFNFSVLNNLATKKATGDFFIFLNDDTEVISPDWIESLLEHAQRTEVGVVGAKLIYQDNTVQHGGVILVDHGGGARHAFRYYPANADGYHHFLRVVRNVSASTFACVMVSKPVFLMLAGLDEQLKVECNDIDFCLRALKQGYKNVWTPFALLYHKELTSRGSINFPQDTGLFWSRWRPILEKGDPYFNPNLTLDSDSFTFNLRTVLIQHHEPCGEGLKMTFHRNTPIPLESIHKILIVKLDHIGDLVLALPAIKLLRTKFPRAHMTALVGSWAKPIIDAVPEIDEMISFNFFNEKSGEGERNINNQELINLQHLLRERKFDLAIDLRKRPETRKILKLCGAPYTVGYCAKEMDEGLSICLYPSPEMEDIPHQVMKPHMAVQLCQLVQAIENNSPFEEISLTSLFPSFSLQGEEDLLKRFFQWVDKDFLVGIHPGAGSSLKQWPIAYFSRLADLLIERCDAQVVLFGAERDKQSVLEIYHQMKYKDKVVSLGGKTSLEEFMNIVRYCHLFIGNDSGPCHLSGVLDVPTLSISSGEVLPHEWHPLGEKTLSIRMDLPCSPCYKASLEQCPFDLKCLKLLWPEKVMEAVDQLLAISGFSKKLQIKNWER